MYSYLASRELRKAGKFKGFDSYLSRLKELYHNPEHEKDRFFQIANFCHTISQDILPTISLENVAEHYEQLISMIKSFKRPALKVITNNNNTSSTTPLSTQYGNFWQSIRIDSEEILVFPMSKFFNRDGKNPHISSLYYYCLFQWHGFNAVKHIYESKDFSSILKLARNGCCWVLDHLYTFLDLNSGFLNPLELEEVKKLLAVDPIDQFVSLLIEKPNISSANFKRRLQTLSNDNPGNLFIKFQCTEELITNDDALSLEIAQKHMHHLSEMGFGQATKWLAFSHDVDDASMQKCNLSQKLKEDYFKLALFQGHMYELSYATMMEIESSATICLINSFIKNKIRKDIIDYAMNKLGYNETEFSNLFKEISDIDFNDETLDQLAEDYGRIFPNINSIKQNSEAIINANFEIKALIELKLGKMFEIKDECGLENNISNLNLN